MRLFRKHSVRVLFRGGDLYVVMPCEKVEALKGFVHELKVRKGECVVKLGHADVEEILEKLNEGGFQPGDITLEVGELEARGEVGVLVCPECFSPNVKRVDIVGLTPPLYICEDCGYKGSLVLELKHRA